MGTDTDRRGDGLVRPIVWAQAGEPVREVAGRLDGTDQSCVLVVVDRALGIVTDHDFRRLIATGRVEVDAPVARLASVPAHTVDERAVTSDALLRMVEHGCHHLVVTRRGEPVGVVRAVDLAQFEVREPLHLRASIDTAGDVEALAALVGRIPDTLVALRESGLPARSCGAIHTALVEAVLGRLLGLRDEPELHGVAWLLLGSLARKEPLPNSDVDTALVWPEPPPEAEPEPDRADAIRAAAARVLEDLRRCGLSPCPSGANADNPLFSRSRDGWAQAATRWLHDSTVDGALLLSAMVTDSRPVTETELGRHVTDQLLAHTRTSQFLRALLDEAVAWRPPTGLLRGFLVQRSGEHRGRLDLKRGGLVPIVALARWVAIVTGDNGGDTLDRLRRGADAGLISEDERHTLSLGFDSVFTLLYDLEVGALRAGVAPTTFVNPDELDTLPRRHLRETLRAVHDVQNRVDQSWIRRLDR